MMDAEKQPLNKLNQQKQTLEWKRDAYREMNTQIADMYSTTFNNMLMSTNWNKNSNKFGFQCQRGGRQC